MLKKIFAAILTVATVLVMAVLPAEAANRRGDATWSSNGSTLTIRTNGGATYRFGAAEIHGYENACSDNQISNIVNSYPGSDTRRIPYVGTIDSLIGDLESREYGDGIYWEITDCGKPMGGLLSGILCIDFEAGYQDRRRVFESCANVSQVGRPAQQRRRIPVVNY